MINETINLLGVRAEDKVTGTRGVITSICFDLFGCVQAALTPPVKESGELVDSRWFDVNRLTTFPAERVMDVPDFDANADRPADYNKGAAHKPEPRG